MTDRIGQRFGDFRLMHSLGGGTFGDVYLGEHIYESTQAAIKVFKTQLTSDQFKDFLNEVRMVLLKHPHIVQVLDFGVSEDDIPFLVMEHAPNGTLLQRHPRGTQLPLATTVTYVKQIAAALQHAHNQRRIHRDVKPENILIGRNNEILLGDFGIAVVAHNTHSQRTEETIGTARYMAPEQWQGKPLPATDQYALGIVTYEWISGVCPFVGNQLQLMYQHIQSFPPPLREKVSTLSPEVEKVILKALAKDPKERFPNIEDFASALERVWQSQEPTRIIPVDRAPVQPRVYVPTQPAPSPSIAPTEVSPEASSRVQKPTSVIKPMGPASPRPNEAGSPSIIVDQRGSGHFTTIGEALKAAKDNDRIVLRPGIYRGELTLSKPVELVADGPIKQVVIESQNGNCLLMQTDRATVRGFTFRCQAGKNGKSGYGVDIARGQLVLEDCHITSDSSDCVAIHNAGTNPIIRRCHIFDGQSDGVSVHDGGEGTIEDCDIYGNGSAGVFISEQGNPLIRQCRIFNGQSYGVWVWRAGKGRIEDCDIYGNKSAGVHISKQGNPVIRQCRIFDGQSYGVNVYEGGKGRIEDCDIYGNQRAGVMIQTQSNPVIRQCRIFNGQSHGVWVYQGGKGTIEDCEIHGNIHSEVAISGSFQKQVEQNSIIGRTRRMIMVFAEGFSEQSNPVIKRCRIFNGQSHGVNVYEGGKGTIEDCDIYGNQRAGVVIRNRGNPTIKRCKIVDGKKYGVWVYSAGRGIIEDCTIHGNQGGDWKIELWCRVVRRGNKE